MTFEGARLHIGDIADWLAVWDRRGDSFAGVDPCGHVIINVRNTRSGLILSCGDTLSLGLALLEDAGGEWPSVRRPAHSLRLKDGSLRLASVEISLNAEDRRRLAEALLSLAVQP